MDFAVPISLHGDGVPVFGVGKSSTVTFDTYSIQSLFVFGATLKVKQYICGVFADLIADDTSLEMWRIMCWSLHWLYKGRWPPVDCYGKPWARERTADIALADTELADGLFCPLLALKGDLDYFAKSLKLRHYNANEMCDLCPAHRYESDKAGLYNNFSASATWPHKCYTSTAWRALYIGRFLHWLFCLAGVDNSCIEPDELHVLHLGVTQYTIGSTLEVLVNECLRDTPEKNMWLVWGKIQEYYRKVPTSTQYTNLGLSSFGPKEGRDKHFPCLKGKGAEAKDLLPAVREVWVELGCAHRDFVIVGSALASLVETQDLLHAHSDLLILPRGIADRIRVCVDSFLVNYQKLAFQSECNGQMLWSCPSKFHWLWHWARKAYFLNPRRTNCYIDEDFVGRHACNPTDTMAVDTINS